MNQERMIFAAESSDAAATNQKAWKYLYDLNSVSRKQLNKIAMMDGVCKYTYEEMFKLWKKFAAVFTALKMTGRNHSKVGIIGSSGVDETCSIYGLNMTGAAVSVISVAEALNADAVRRVIISEKLTDMILPDEFLRDDVFKTLLKEKNSLGLNNIILLHIPMSNPALPKVISNFMEDRAKRNAVKYWNYYMDSLIYKYGNGPVDYADYDGGTALIMHSSGTTTGKPKPVELSDLALNTVGQSMRQLEGYDFLFDNLVTAVSVDTSNTFGFVDQIQLTFAYGGTVCSSAGETLNPLYFRSIAKYKATILYCAGFVFEMWTKFPDNTPFDFSSLKGVVLGGSFVSVQDKHRYMEFLRKHGGRDITMVTGYGISELSGVVTLASPDPADDTVGIPIPGMNVLLMDEDSGEFHSIDDGEHTGILHVSSDTMCNIDTISDNGIETVEIDGRTYICTNDLMSTDENGRLTYLGRGHRYYLNNNHIIYQAGRVETLVSSQNGIVSCGIAPIFDKFAHDTVPMLCIQCLDDDTNPEETVRKALMEIFAHKRLLPSDQLPSWVMITRQLPRNHNGKVSIFLLSKNKCAGSRYRVEFSAKGNFVDDIRLLKTEEDAGNLVESIYKNLARELVPEYDNSMASQLLKHTNLSNPEVLTRLLVNMIVREEYMLG